MVTDPLFYKICATTPETFFLLLGLSLDEAAEMAARYEYEALEIKETAHRLDGIFKPKDPSLPIYFVEFQFYYDPAVFVALEAKAYSYLKKGNPGQSIRRVIVFGERSHEPTEVAPVQSQLATGQIQRYYLDEMPELAGAPIGLSILYLIKRTESEAAKAGRELIVRIKQEVENAAVREELINLIEQVLVYKLSHLGREEIQAMLRVHDIRETRFFKEVKQEGLEEGLEKGREEGLEKGRKEGLEKGRGEERARYIDSQRRAVLKLAAKNTSIEEIADILGLEIDFVREVIAGKKHDLAARIANESTSTD